MEGFNREWCNTFPPIVMSYNYACCDCCNFPYICLGEVSCIERKGSRLHIWFSTYGWESLFSIKLCIETRSISESIINGFRSLKMTEENFKPLLYKNEWLCLLDNEYDKKLRSHSYCFMFNFVCIDRTIYI